MSASIYYIILSILCFQEVVLKNITVGLTYNTVNLTNLDLILRQSLQLSKCSPNNYSIKFVRYNTTELFKSPIGNNDFSETYLIFGPIRYFSPFFYGFTGTNTGFLFESGFINGYSLEIDTRYTIMLEVLNKALRNDIVKSAIFIISGNIVNTQQPWKAFNPHQYMALFDGTLTVFTYYNSSDAVRIASAIKSMAATNIVMDLGSSDALAVLNACNARNLLNWRQRWMIYYSLLSNTEQLSKITLPLSNNLTIFDFGRITNFTNFYINSQTDFYLYDVCYTLVSLMDYQNCNQTMPSTLNLGTGVATYSGNRISKPMWLINAYQTAYGILVKIGNITVGPNLSVSLNYQNIPNQYNRSNDQILTEMRSKVFRIAAMWESPFVFYNSNGVLTGHSIDVINTILGNLNLKGNITVYNMSTGRLQNGQFSGLLGILQSGFADIAIGPVTYFDSYQNYINMTIPYKTYNLAVIYNSTQQIIYQQMFEFIFMFSWPVWILIVGSCFVYAVALTVVNLISPNEAKMGLLDTFFFTMGSIVQGVTTALPDKVSGRILVIFWWILNICILLAYVANYGANRTSNRLQANITTDSDLLLQTKYSFGTVTNSSLDEFLSTNPDPSVQQINSVIRSIYINKMTTSTNASMDLVTAGLFAFIYQDAVLTQYLSRRCLTMVTGLQTFQYVYALTDSDYTTVINTQLANLTASNIMSTLNAKYFGTPNISTCVDSSWLGNIMNILTTEFLASRKDSLTIQDTAGIFIIMLIGIIISVFVALVEFIVRKCSKKKVSNSESEA